MSSLILLFSLLYGADTVVVFYLTFQLSYSYTRLGRVDDPSDLPRALGPRGVRVHFFQGLAFRNDERHQNETASRMFPAVHLADGTCDPGAVVRPRFRRNARR